MPKSTVLALTFYLLLGTVFERTPAAEVGKRQYQIQNGPCSYTFLLPQEDNCEPPSSYRNLAQKDDPAEYEDSFQRLEQLENTMENNTQWLLKLENYIQDSMKQEMVHIQQTAVQNHTATMIEIGTNLLSHTAEQTRKLTNVEAQVINHSTRLERQLLENSISTSKLEKELILQTNEISKLNDKNSFLEKRVGEMEQQRQSGLETVQREKEQLQRVIQGQTDIIEELQRQLHDVSSNNTALQRQQHQLLATVNDLVHTLSAGPVGDSKPIMMQDTPSTFRDCAAVFKSGNTETGVYALTLPNTTQEVKAFCDMETEGGGWTTLQKRFDGRVDFHRTWKEYKMGFGDPLAEYWLGNEFVSKLIYQQSYILRIQLSDWEGNSGYSQYEQFSLEGEAKNYRITLKGYSGTAGKISSLGTPGSDFRWWFDACGPSNLNGMYYKQGQNSNRFNGIKWYYWKGSGYSLKTTTMMIRPTGF
ncbi:hypothetical protein NHX12_022733 [Muraenolepis orangiensis]|uniref:Fibrinogen C-terminal domain-containing protein n=1 Tax=Muraenolepis orangiensis TaxID=630683 RepID=A0A9Q0EP46_9TELE|nr:hypothetical protein NHX12_022733 [Muraenolepis orangiensis]